MSWIALKMLVGDRAKFLGIVMGLTFAALLITQQGSIFCGLMLRTAGQITDITGADLWVMDPSVRYIDDVKPMIENNLYRVRGVEGVLWAVPLYKGQARVKVSPLERAERRERNSAIEQVILLGLDDTSMVGAPAPAKMFCGNLWDLRRPDAVIVDNTRLMKLYPPGIENWGELGPLVAKLGKDEGEKAFYARFLNRELEMNDRRAIIVGICEATRTFQSNPVVYTTYSRAKLYAPQERKILSYILAKTEPGLTADSVADRIKRETGLGAKTSTQFTEMTIWYYMLYTGIPINFGITAALGFLVGTAIAGQTFYNFTLENLKQFGALKAMGATNWRIVKMILLQALVVGLLGYGIGVGLAEIFGWKNQSPKSDMAFFVPKAILDWLAIPHTPYKDATESQAGGGALGLFWDYGPVLISVVGLSLLAWALRLARLFKPELARRIIVILGSCYVLTTMLAYRFMLQGMTTSELAFYTWWPVLVITGVAVVLICILASLLSIARVMVLEPAVVFRG
jgi:putative ABC transport system permease protein